MKALKGEKTVAKLNKLSTYNPNQLELHGLSVELSSSYSLYTHLVLVLDM